MSSDRWLLRGVEVSGSLVDCRVGDGQVVEVGTGLAGRAGERLVDGRGGALLPGLADHHIHVLATAASRSSVDLRGSHVLDASILPPGRDWARVIGAGSELRREDLDERWPDRPVRVQHRSGALWTLSSTAVEALAHGLSPAERESGQLWRADNRLRALLGDVDHGVDDDLRRLGAELASYGITHLTDASPDLDESGMALVTAQVPQRTTFMGEAGAGPRKIVLADHTSLSYDDLRDEVMRCHGLGRPVAVHAVTSESLAVSIAVLSEVGVLPGDRIEHAAMCDDSAAGRLAALGVVVVTQPTIFARHERAFVDGTPEGDRSLLWRHRGLLDAGVRVVVSSDAPYGDADPGRTIRASTERGPEAVSATVALESFLLDPFDLLGPMRTIAPGVPADLCLLANPLGRALDDVASGQPWRARATFVAGTLVASEHAASSL